MGTVRSTIFNINVPHFVHIVFICFVWHVVSVHAVKVYWADELRLHSFLILALDASEWPVSLFAHFAPGKGFSVPFAKEARVGTRAGLDALGKKEISCPCRKSSCHNKLQQPVGVCKRDELCCV